MEKTIKPCTVVQVTGGTGTHYDENIIQVTGGTGTYYGEELPKDACLTLKSSDYETNNIVFYAGQNNEMMRINPEGFFWKGKLIENDKEIYLKVKEFFNMPNK